MDIKKYFPDEEIKKMEKVLVPFHDRFLLDKTIGNTEAIILSTYMVSNELKKSMVSQKEVKELVLNMGRTSDEFSKAIYEISGKRKGKTGLVTVEKDMIGLNFEGLKKIKGILMKQNG